MKLTIRSGRSDNAGDAGKVFKNVLKNPTMIKTSIEKLIEQEKELYGDSIGQFKDVAKYIKTNWKVVVPALAALAASAFFVEGSMSGRRLAPATHSRRKVN